MREGWLGGDLREVARVQGRDIEDLKSWGGRGVQVWKRLVPELGTFPKLKSSLLKFKSD